MGNSSQACFSEWLRLNWCVCVCVCGIVLGFAAPGWHNRVYFCCHGWKFLSLVFFLKQLFLGSFKKACSGNAQTEGLLVRQVMINIVGCHYFMSNNKVLIFKLWFLCFFLRLWYASHVPIMCSPSLRHNNPLRPQIKPFFNNRHCGKPLIRQSITLDLHYDTKNAHSSKSPKHGRSPTRATNKNEKRLNNSGVTA